MRRTRARPAYSFGPRPAVETRRAAEVLLRTRLAAAGIGLEPLPDLPLAYALLPRGGKMRIVKMLAQAAPHRRGGRGSLGLHWLLPSDFEEFVALVNVSREAVWLLPAPEFRSRAQRLEAGRYHLDWLVVRLGRSNVADELEFEPFRLENVIESEGFSFAHPGPVEGGPGNPVRSWFDRLTTSGDTEALS